MDVDKRNKALKTLVNGLTTENLKMKCQFDQMRLENTDLKKTVEQLVA